MKIKWGAMVVAGSGKIGGQVAARNAAGSYLRNKVTPVNPRTTSQVEARARLASNAKLWVGLPEVFRLDWNAAAKNFSSKNVFGDNIRLSGINVFSRLNNNLALIGKSFIPQPPAAEGLASPSSVMIASTVTGSILTVTAGEDVPAGNQMVIRMTPPQSAGKNFVQSEFRVLTTADAGTTGAIDVSSDYVQKFGALPKLGQKVFAEVFFISETSGIASQRVRDGEVTGS